MTTIESLKVKLDKKKAEAKEIEKLVKEAEAAELEAQKLVAKLETLSASISEAIQNVLNQAEVKLPEGKQIITIVGSKGDLLTNIVNGKVSKTKAGNSGAKTITYEGEQISWSRLCELTGIVRTPSGSAHRDCFNKAKDLHNSIQHECSIDGKTYPVA